jgi:hypothetical protein
MTTPNPPKCLPISVDNVGFDTTYAPADNFYTADITLTDTTSPYGSVSSYSITDITLTMWIASSSSGAIYKIKRIDSTVGSKISCSLEDLSGLNKKITNRILRGKPAVGSGYAFEVNSTTALPSLVSVLN